ncbi:MAG: hypothetical protein JWL69_3973 [Phycisphaerales bacterium]|nr:hypothetical protein [Phycisphaerales bacterium]MDB5358581.1 hypothetical protein [Phycisphaerales bacterium]
MYRMLDNYRPCSDLGRWQAVVGEYTDVVGWTYFGDFFLRNAMDGRYAVLMPMWPHLSRLKYSDRESFVEVYLKREYVVRRGLRPVDVAALERRLGKLGPEEIFVPPRLPSVADSEDLTTYRKSNVWDFAAALAASHGIGDGAAVDLLLQHLRAKDDFYLWRVAVAHILSELTPSPGMLVQIGCCSHWLRPHQTRWTADGGFAWPTGYGSGTGGFSRNALPQFDWSVTLAWTSGRWELASNKSARPSLRVTIPSRTRLHEQAAIHTLWMTGKEKESRFYGFRHQDDGWRCTAESKWAEERAPKARKKRQGNKRAGNS